MAREARREANGAGAAKLQVRGVDFVPIAIRVVVARHASEQIGHKPLMLQLFRAQLQEQLLHFDVRDVRERRIKEVIRLALGRQRDDLLAGNGRPQTP